MKKIEEKTNLKNKTVPELKALAKTLKEDMVRLFIEKKNRRLQNTMLPSQKKKMYAQILTILKDKSAFVPPSPDGYGGQVKLRRGKENK